MKNYKETFKRASEDIDQLMMYLMKVKVDLKNGCKDCPDEPNGEGEGKKRRRRKNKKTTVTKGKPGPKPKAEKATEPNKPGRPPMRRVVGQSN